MFSDKLAAYVHKFNSDDTECHINDIDNVHAFAWLQDNVPLFECPDETIEEIYYFRWWTFRKHIKHTEDGFVITEFLPKVPWSGKHNAIVAPIGHQVNEGKWLKISKQVLTDYLQYYLDGIGNIYDYSTWFIDAVLKYCKHCDDMAFAVKNLDKLITYFETFHKAHITCTGLYFSYDGDDAMECSISGGCTWEEKAFPGLRPTLNSYMAANAFALAEIAEAAGRKDVTEKYQERGEFIVRKMFELLWDGSFFKAAHSRSPAKDHFPRLNELAYERNARELLGYIPWCFDFMPAGCESAFEDMLSADGFQSKHGLTTAEQRHKRFMYEYGHSCLWNGYIWPFATTQALDAVQNLLENYAQSIISKEDYYRMIQDYARMHYRVTDDGKKICWIDEVMNPVTGEWSSRLVLESWGWLERKGGKERGRDYNHSAFCNIILGGLLGIKVENGSLSVEPKIPESWDYFAVDNLYIDDDAYTVLYDRDGSRYRLGKGLIVKKKQ